MERPQVETQTKQRNITGEIMYLDHMREQNKEPKPYHELGETALMYEAHAKMYPPDERPSIMDEYEQYDSKPSEVVASCAALADELLTLKEAGSTLTFVDISVAVSPDTALTMLKAITAGSILTRENEQLAIPSDGEYYPILDMRKQNAQLVGVGLRAWGWDYNKYVFTNKEGEPYKYPEHALVYPSDEKSSSRQLELSFGYRDKDAGGFSESVSLHVASDGSASISSRIWSSAYAETGYEGHGGSSLRSATDDDIAAFGDLIAEIVGDEPESMSMKVKRQLQELTDTAATPSAKAAIQDLIETTWPAQANYFLTRSLQEGTDITLAQQLRDETTADAAAKAVNTIIKKWRARWQR